MTILSRYVTKETCKVFSIVLIAVVSIYIAVDFIEKIDDFIEAGVPTNRAVVFFLYKTPFIIAQITPVGLLLSILVVFGLMSKNNEVAALKSSGVSVYRLLQPACAMGIFFSISLFMVSEFVVPVTMVKANKIWLQDVRKKNLVSTRENDIWMKGDRQIIHIDHYDAAAKTVFGVTLNFFDDNFILERRVDSEKGVFENGEWVFFNLMEQVIDADTGNYVTAMKEKQAETLGLVPDDLETVAKETDEMGLAELYRYIKKIEREGYGTVKLLVDFYAKTAFPFVCIIMSILGTGLAVRGKLKEGLPVSITYGLAIAFLYWIFFSFCLSIGYGEMIPPLIAAWMANLVFICISTIFLLNAE